MPEAPDDVKKPLAVWMVDPETRRMLAYVEADERSYHATLGDGSTVDVATPEMASALARCLLLAVADEHVPALALRTNRGSR